MNAIELKKILEKHLHWIRADCDGWQNMRANLGGADLRGADLHKADLRKANLYGANLYRADLHGANLNEADLRKANLYEADLYRADLHGANLNEADLYGANLRKADLYGTNLYGANLRKADLHEADLHGIKIEGALMTKHFPICCPECGSFIGWKKANGYIVKLKITEDAKRSSAFGRKCRCNKAQVLGIENMDGSKSGINQVASEYDNNFVYRVGETLEVENFDEDRKIECAPGIHFFITRQEAVNY